MDGVCCEPGRGHVFRSVCDAAGDIETLVCDGCTLEPRQPRSCALCAALPTLVLKHKFAPRSTDIGRNSGVFGIGQTSADFSRSRPIFRCGAGFGRVRPSSARNRPHPARFRRNLARPPRAPTQFGTTSRARAPEQFGTLRPHMRMPCTRARAPRRPPRGGSRRRLRQPRLSPGRGQRHGRGRAGGRPPRGGEAHRGRRGGRPRHARARGCEAATPCRVGDAGARQDGGDWAMRRRRSGRHGGEGRGEAGRGGGGGPCGGGGTVWRDVAAAVGRRRSRRRRRGEAGEAVKAAWRRSRRGATGPRKTQRGPRETSERPQRRPQRGSREAPERP